MDENTSTIENDENLITNIQFVRNNNRRASDCSLNSSLCDDDLAYDIDGIENCVVNIDDFDNDEQKLIPAIVLVIL